MSRTEPECWEDQSKSAATTTTQLQHHIDDACTVINDIAIQSTDNADNAESAKNEALLSLAGRQSVGGYHLDCNTTADSRHHTQQGCVVVLLR